MIGSQKDDLHEFISYDISLINNKDRQELIWDQYHADSWLEELVEFWEDYKKLNPGRPYQYDSIDNTCYICRYFLRSNRN